MRTSTVLCLVLTLVCVPAYAQEVAPPTPPTVPPGEDKIEYLEKDAPAPYPGFLYDADTAVRWGNWLTFWKKRYVVDLTEQKKVCGIREDTQTKIHLVEVEARNRIIEEQRRRLEEVENPPWYETQWFGVGVGATGAFSLTLLSIWAVGQASR
jgi:hypothetical protein